MLSTVKYALYISCLTLLIGCNTAPKRPEVDQKIVEKINSKTIDKGYSRVHICSGNVVWGFLKTSKIPTVRVLIDSKETSDYLTTLDGDEQVVLDFRFNKRVHITSNKQGSLSTTLSPTVGSEQFLTFDQDISRPDPTNKEHNLLAANAGAWDYISIIQLKVEKNKLDDSRCVGKKITFYKVVD